MSIIIDGKIIAEEINKNITAEIIAGHKDLINCPRPNLAIILVGNKEDSKLYVSKKEEEAKKVGIDTHLYKCDEDVSEEKLIEIIDFLNNDVTIDAILVQLPLPKNFDTDKIIKSIDPKKDVDRFHPDNIAIISANACTTKLLPPVFLVVKEMLKVINFNYKEKNVVVLANSDIFGKNLVKVLECYECNASFIKPDDKNLINKTIEADLLIVAVGKPKFIKKHMIKEDAVIIDIGINKDSKGVCGDVDFEDVEEKCSFITPVPGGVGPLTIAMTFQNTLELYKLRKKNR